MVEMLKYAQSSAKLREVDWNTLRQEVPRVVKSIGFCWRSRYHKSVWFCPSSNKIPPWSLVFLTPPPPGSWFCHCSCWAILSAKDKIETGTDRMDWYLVDWQQTEIDQLGFVWYQSDGFEPEESASVLMLQPSLFDHFHYVFQTNTKTGLSVVPRFWKSPQFWTDYQVLFFLTVGKEVPRSQFLVFGECQRIVKIYRNWS